MAHYKLDKIKWSTNCLTVFDRRRLKSVLFKTERRIWRDQLLYQLFSHSFFFFSPVIMRLISLVGIKIYIFVRVCIEKKSDYKCCEPKSNRRSSFPLIIVWHWQKEPIIMCKIHTYSLCRVILIISIQIDLRNVWYLLQSELFNTA